MNIPKDKIAHAVAGLLVAIGAVLVLVIAQRFGLAWAILAAGGAVGVAYELVQKLRGEGQPDVMDAVATLAGSALLAVAVHLSGWQP